MFLLRIYVGAGRLLPASGFLTEATVPGHGLLGFDAVACVQRIEAWVTEVHNSSHSVLAAGNLGKAASIDELKTDTRPKKVGSVDDNRDIVVRDLVSNKNKSSALCAAYTATQELWLGVRA